MLAKGDIHVPAAAGSSRSRLADLGVELLDLVIALSSGHRHVITGDGGNGQCLGILLHRELGHSFLDRYSRLEAEIQGVTNVAVAVVVDGEVVQADCPALELPTALHGHLDLGVGGSDFGHRLCERKEG